MIAEQTEAAPAPMEESKSSFFRQSGWMLVAAIGSGFCMYAVHKVAGKMPKEEYGVFLTLLQVLNMMTIPAIGLQLVFAHQAALAVTEKERGQLRGTVRGVIAAACLLWLVIVGVVFFYQGDIALAYKIANPAAIWVTVVLALMTAFNPIMMGLLQGKMNFFALGWALMLNGVGRLVAITVIVLLFSGYAAGAMIGALVGVLAAVGLAGWHTREIWLGKAEAMEWRSWLKQVVPLTVGFGAATVMLSLDMVVVQRFFPKEETGFYGAAGMIGRALVFLVSPLTQVMFPKVVQSAARAEKTSVLAQALGATALLGGMAALFCTIFPTLPLRILYDDSYLRVAHLVPWFAWCMLPLTLASVLINNLLAHRRFGVVIWLVVVAGGYWWTLWHYHESFESVVKTLGIFGLLFLAGCMGFSLRKRG